MDISIEIIKAATSIRIKPATKAPTVTLIEGNSETKKIRLTKNPIPKAINKLTSLIQL